MSDEIVVAILAKDKAHILPYYLQCLLNQTYPKDKIHLYIRTNDNNDSTESVLKEFIDTHMKSYASIFFDARSIDESIKNYGHHEWNCKRFSILGKIRQESIDYAIRLDANYFVADCDNFINPETISEMFSMKHLGIIAPLLRTTTLYSNYHYSVTDIGYYEENPTYFTILENKIRGCFQVAVVHCTYFISVKNLKDCSYENGTGRHEYVIFSDTLRKKNIPQYIDNRHEYGTITFAATSEEFLQETNHSLTKL